MHHNEPAETLKCGQSHKNHELDIPGPWRCWLYYSHAFLGTCELIRSLSHLKQARMLVDIDDGKVRASPSKQRDELCGSKLLPSMSKKLALSWIVALSTLHHSSANQPALSLKAAWVSDEGGHGSAARSILPEVRKGSCFELTKRGTKAGGKWARKMLRSALLAAASQTMYPIKSGVYLSRFDGLCLQPHSHQATSSSWYRSPLTRHDDLQF